MRLLKAVALVGLIGTLVAGLVWAVEIVLIVGGHILGVLAAHRLGAATVLR